jgi:hypothetical protein
MRGPTRQGAQGLIDSDPGASWDAASESVRGSAYGTSPRVIKIAFFDPRYTPKSGRNYVIVSKLGAFFIERVSANSQVTGVFMGLGTQGEGVRSGDRASSRCGSSSRPGEDRRGSTAGSAPVPGPRLPAAPLAGGRMTACGSEAGGAGAAARAAGARGAAAVLAAGAPAPRPRPRGARAQLSRRRAGPRRAGGGGALRLPALCGARAGLASTRPRDARAGRGVGCAPGPAAPLAARRAAAVVAGSGRASSSSRRAAGTTLLAAQSARDSARALGDSSSSGSPAHDGHSHLVRGDPDIAILEFGADPLLDQAERDRPPAPAWAPAAPSSGPTAGRGRARRGGGVLAVRPDRPRSPSPIARRLALAGRTAGAAEASGRRPTSPAAAATARWRRALAALGDSYWARLPRRAARAHARVPAPRASRGGGRRTRGPGAAGARHRARGVARPGVRSGRRSTTTRRSSSPSAPAATSLSRGRA